MRCNECESLDTTGSRFCECCGRPMPAASGAVHGEAVTQAGGWAAEMTTPVGEAPAAEAPPAPAPGSVDYLRTCQGSTTLDSGYPHDATSVGGAMRGSQATTSEARLAPAVEPTSSIVADPVASELSGDEEYPVAAPWWAARSAPPASNVTAAGMPSGAASPVASPPTSVARQAGAGGPAQVLAPALETTPRPPRVVPPRRTAVRTGSAPAPAARRSGLRPPGRLSRFLAQAAVALVAVGAASLLGAPVVKQWSATLPGSVGGYLDIASPKDPATRDEGAGSHSLRDAEPIVHDTARRAPVPEPPVGRSGGTTPSARSAQATSAPNPPSTRTVRNSRRGPAVTTPARAVELAARRDTVEPLAVTPRVSVNTDTIVAPMAAAVPPAVESVAPATALEVTKVDVRPGIVRRVDARASNAPVGTPEMVVLRVLVSATGSPATVQVLRGSKTDPASDGAAVAAVKQWAFSPALKRGRPVDCWFNVAVPVEGTAQ